MKKETRGWFKGWRDGLAKTSLKQAGITRPSSPHLLGRGGTRWMTSTPARRADAFMLEPAGTDLADGGWEIFYEGVPRDMSLAVLLAVSTGQRQGDLLRMCWSRGEDDEPYMMATTCT